MINITRINTIRYDATAPSGSRFYSAKTFNYNLSIDAIYREIDEIRNKVLKGLYDGTIHVDIENFDKSRLCVSESGNICYLNDDKNKYTMGRMTALFGFVPHQVVYFNQTNVIYMYNSSFSASRIGYDWIIVDQNKVAFSKFKYNSFIDEVLDEIDRRIDRYTNPPKPQRLRMIANFEILKDDGTGVFNTIELDESNDQVTPGGFAFCVNNQEIQFDFPAFGCMPVDGHLQYESGYGFLHNDFSLDDCFDREYEALGIDKNDITAEFLASASEIIEFYVDFASNHSDHEFGIGDNSGDSDYRIKILDITFVDMNGDEEKHYPVNPEVIARFNSVK